MKLKSTLYHIEYNELLYRIFWFFWEALIFLMTGGRLVSC